MPKELPKAYDSKATEGKIYKLWQDSGYFNPDNLPKSKNKYAIHLPPPNITGSLHMGHALNATISDILIRYHRMKGDRAVWFPGIDHAGIATQNVVEKELKKEGLNRWQIGREKFIERVWQWKEKYGTIILDQLKKLGASCDWSRTRFTMDPKYADWVMRSFIHYYEKGLIYRGKRVVSWCPRCQTSLSDLEIEYKEEKTKLWFIKYKIVAPTPGRSDDEYVVVATTRPETMLGDMAVAVNPKDKRYKNLVGKKVLLPIQNREIPIIADEGVEMTFGTGAVKVTPAHDLLDAEIAERHNIPFMQVIDDRGRMTEEAGEQFKGLKTKEAREKVIEELEKLNLIEKTDDYDHNLATCYRCGTALEPILSDQWFVKMEELAKKALEAVKSGKVKIIPKRFEKIYFDWLENIKDWTISRQIWWGHQLPVWFCQCEGEDQTVFVGIEPPKVKCAGCKGDFKRSDDVLDTWFSSALWPFAGLSDKDLKDYYPSDILITARDIINLWVGRMIFSGLEFTNNEPFPEVLIHATILTKEGKRMSKSKGTGIDPLVLIDKYGADATRFGIIWQAMGNQDIKWDETAVMAGKKFANKLWNITRFVLGRTGISNFQFSISKLKKGETKDKEILEKLENTKKETEQDINNYDFGQALHKIYDFVWHEFADKYIELSKNRDDKAVKETLSYVLLSSLKLLHPFMPFITEELFQSTIAENELIITSKW